MFREYTGTDLVGFVVSLNLAVQVAELPEEERAVVAAAPVEQMREAAREAVLNHRTEGTGENEWYTPEQGVALCRTRRDNDCHLMATS